MGGLAPDTAPGGTSPSPPGGHQDGYLPPRDGSQYQGP